MDVDVDGGGGGVGPWGVREGIWMDVVDVLPATEGVPRRGAWCGKPQHGDLGHRLGFVSFTTRTPRAGPLCVRPSSQNRAFPATHQHVRIEHAYGPASPRPLAVMILMQSASSLYWRATSHLDLKVWQKFLIRVGVVGQTLPPLWEAWGQCLSNSPVALPTPR